LTTPERRPDVEAYVAQAERQSEIERLSAEKEKTGIFIGAYAINPVNGARIPIWIADYVMMAYGTGAIMAVPAHDERDFEFALRFGLPIIPVIDRPDGVSKSLIRARFVDDSFEAALEQASFNFDVCSAPASGCGNRAEGSDAGGMDAAPTPGMDDRGFCIVLQADQVARFASLVREHLQPGSWCEVVGGQWLFVFNDGAGADESMVRLGSAESDREILARCQALDPTVRDCKTVMELLWARPFYRDVLFHAEYGTMINSNAFSGTLGAVAKQRVTEWLEEQDKGHYKVNYRLHDWLISRQRMWGAPIPIVYCEHCGMVPVPFEDLPVLLPEDATFRPTGESPLKFHEGFLHTNCPDCGGPATRETDTMDTFMCSSWYQYAYLSPYYREGEPVHADSMPFDPREAAYWAPVDVYTGGIEHATMHLIYTRFFTKVMRDLGIVDFDEPMLMLRNQGIILGEDGEKMSKSRGNVIAPDDLVERYGADTVRGYLMFGWRWDQGGPWDSQGIEGVVRFLNRVWDCVLEPGYVGEEQADADAVRDLRRRVHQAIRRGTEDMEAFSFNTYVANLMELNNAMLKAKESPVYRTEAWQEAVEALLLMLAPACPHIAEELWARLGRRDSGADSIHLQPWPVWDEAVAAEEILTLVVQVNGRVRDRVRVPVGVDEEAARKLALETEGAQRHIAGKHVVKVIVVPERLVNIVVK
jgi:leucyl-tRNA synthetase